MDEEEALEKFDAGGAGVYGRALPHPLRATSCVPMEALSQEGGERARISVEREGQCRKVVSMQKERTML
jgi:hypothetical protein